MTDAWRVWRDAAVAESRALRLLPPNVKCRPLCLRSALDDDRYLMMRASENDRARQYRATKKGVRDGV